jgi:multidrug efflux pump subunit AcrA (membrane-fusion protein)
MSAEIEIALGEVKAVLQVPRKAVIKIGSDQVCYVKSAQGIEERKVVIGASNGTSLEIKEGLKEGDDIVADPLLLLRGGAKSKK